MDLLALGSIITLKKDNENTKLMVVTRGAITNVNGEEGFFDYAAVIYPVGIVDNQLYFFNNEDIGKIIFKGFSDEDDKELTSKLLSRMENGQVMRHSVNDVEHQEDLSILLDKKERQE